MKKGETSATHSLNDVERILCRGISKHSKDNRKLKIYEAIVKIKTGCPPQKACHGKMRQSDASMLQDIRISQIIQTADAIKLNVNIHYRI